MDLHENNISLKNELFHGNYQLERNSKFNLHYVYIYLLETSFEDLTFIINLFN